VSSEYKDEDEEEEVVIQDEETLIVIKLLPTYNVMNFGASDGHGSHPFR
jgi:hypothetical protein